MHMRTRSASEIIMRKIILQSERHEPVAEFESEILSHMQPEMLPDILTWNGRHYIFNTMDDASVTYSAAFQFAIVEGVTARKL